MTSTSGHGPHHPEGTAAPLPVRRVHLRDHATDHPAAVAGDGMAAQVESSLQRWFTAEALDDFLPRSDR